MSAGSLDEPVMARMQGLAARHVDALARPQGALTVFASFGTCPIGPAGSPCKLDWLRRGASRAWPRALRASTRPSGEIRRLRPSKQVFARRQRRDTSSQSGGKRYIQQLVRCSGSDECLACGGPRRHGSKNKS
jgi:hypothetical protein